MVSPGTGYIHCSLRCHSRKTWRFIWKKKNSLIRNPCFYPRFYSKCPIYFPSVSTYSKIRRRNRYRSHCTYSYILYNYRISTKTDRQRFLPLYADFQCSCYLWSNPWRINSGGLWLASAYVDFFYNMCRVFFTMFFYTSQTNLCQKAYNEF